MLSEGDTFRINGSFGAPEKSLLLILVKQTQNFAWVYIVILITAFCLIMEKKYLSLKPTIEMLVFQLNFVSEAYLMDLMLQSLEKYL